MSYFLAHLLIAQIALKEAKLFQGYLQLAYPKKLSHQEVLIELFAVDPYVVASLPSHESRIHLRHVSFTQSANHTRPQTCRHVSHLHCQSTTRGGLYPRRCIPHPQPASPAPSLSGRRLAHTPLYSPTCATTSLHGSALHGSIRSGPPPPIFISMEGVQPDPAREAPTPDFTHRPRFPSKASGRKHRIVKMAPSTYPRWLRVCTMSPRSPSRSAPRPRDVPSARGVGPSSSSDACV